MRDGQHFYRGRLAPSPTGYLHLGHARTFRIAAQRARAAGGRLVLRNDDLDATRFQMEYSQAILEDLRWFGLTGMRVPMSAGRTHRTTRASGGRSTGLPWRNSTPPGSSTLASARAGT